ncbi:ABC transporter ATP-binding protein [Leuconostoc sp. MS02]|uniref:ABC transporter ATP-binding protein n=1 Tax=Leuconostoc aquikimchii TaxID=3236804 RepID=A0ABV3S535_9LACO
MLIAKNISKTFAKTNNAVSDISLSMKEGKIIGLLGVNGAGKTTTIKMLSGLLNPDTGHIFIDDIELTSQTKYLKNKLNIIPGGERNLYWRLTGRENLEYFGSLYGLRGKKCDDQINEILSTVQLINAADILVENYSKGMKQRLQIARGLINDPTYIFLDEPTLGLDILIAKEVRQHLKHLAVDKQKGILLTSHYIREVEELCDYIYVLDAGNIIFEGTPTQLNQQLTIDSDVVSLTVDDTTKIVGFFKQYVVSENELTISVESLQATLAHLSSENISVLDIKITRHTLEDSLVTLFKETAK